MRRARNRRFPILLDTSRRFTRILGLCLAVLCAITWTAGSALAAPSPHSSPPPWGAGTSLVNGTGGVTTVSCASANFCVAGDLSGAVSSYNGTSWSGPLTVDPQRTIAGVSCPTVTFCVATDRSGQYVIFSNGTWSAPAPFTSSSGVTMVAVSCGSPSFCLAVGHSASFGPADYYYVNGAWYPDPGLFAATDNYPFNAVSCTSEFVCWATDQGGGVMSFTYTPGPQAQFMHAATPTSIDPTDSNYVGTSIACVSATSCVVGSAANQVSTLNAATWSTVTEFTSTSLGVLVSCAASTCVANDSLSQGVSAVAPFTTWSGMGQLNALSQITDVSCFPTGTSVACLAVDNDGFSVMLSLGAGGVPAYQEASSVFDAPRTLTSVTCASATYCVASDAAGEIITLRGGAWSAPRTITTSPLGIREIRCGGSAHPYRSLRCTAALGNLLALQLTSYRAQWESPASLTSPAYAVGCAAQCVYLSPEGRSSGLVGGYLPGLPSSAIVTDVSCPPEGVGCVAIDSSGNSYVSQAKVWIAGPRVTSKGIPWSLSCVTQDFCVAIDIEGQAFTYDGVSWGRPRLVTSRGLDGVSCGATYFCVASDLTGEAYTYDGRSWSAGAQVSTSGALRGLACASASSCVAIDATHAYPLEIPTARSRISILAAQKGGSVVGRTIIAVRVTSTSAPSGLVTLSITAGHSVVSCTATLKKVGPIDSAAHCIVRATRAGSSIETADFAGSFGFGAATAARDVRITAR